MADKIGNSQFKFGYWWVNNKIKIQKFLKIGLIGLNIIIGIFLIINLADYLIHIPEANKLSNEISSQQINFQSVSQPTAIEIGKSYVFSAGKDKADLMGEITNTNTNWAAKSFKYTFTGGGAQGEPIESFISPGETKTLTMLGVSSSGSLSSSPKLIITDVEWERIKTELPETDFSFNDLTYASADSVGQDESTGSIVSGTILNKSAYGFYEAKITIIMQYGGKPIGVGVTRITDFKSFEERPIELRFPERYPLGVDIIPEVEVNILDQDNLIYPGQ